MAMPAGSSGGQTAERMTIRDEDFLPWDRWVLAVLNHRDRIMTGHSDPALYEEATKGRAGVRLVFRSEDDVQVVFGIGMKIGQAKTCWEMRDIASIRTLTVQQVDKELRALYARCREEKRRLDERRRIPEGVTIDEALRQLIADADLVEVASCLDRIANEREVYLNLYAGVRGDDRRRTYPSPRAVRAERNAEEELRRAGHG